MKNATYEPRQAQHHERVEHLLTLAQLKQMGHSDERQWAAVLRANHLADAGAPPPRRQVDDPALRTR